jgi:hypothetical protein
MQLNPHVNPFQRSFVGEVRRIEEMARRVRFFSIQIAKEQDAVAIRPLHESSPFITVGPRAAQTIDELDLVLAGHEQRLIRMNSSYESLSERTKELIEAQYVLRETAIFFNKVIHLSTYFFFRLYISLYRRRKIMKLIFAPHSTTARRLLSSKLMITKQALVLQAECSLTSSTCFN